MHFLGIYLPVLIPITDDAHLEEVSINLSTYIRYCDKIDIKKKFYILFSIKKEFLQATKNNERALKRSFMNKKSNVKIPKGDSIDNKIILIPKGKFYQ